MHHLLLWVWTWPGFCVKGCLAGPNLVFNYGQAYSYFNQHCLKWICNNTNFSVFTERWPWGTWWAVVDGSVVEVWQFLLQSRMLITCTWPCSLLPTNCFLFLGDVIIDFCFVMKIRISRREEMKICWFCPRMPSCLKIHHSRHV